MEDEYAFHLKLLDNLNEVMGFGDVYYIERAKRISAVATKKQVASSGVFEVLIEAIKLDIKDHPNQERLAFLIEQIKKAGR